MLHITREPSNAWVAAGTAKSFESEGQSRKQKSLRCLRHGAPIIKILYHTNRAKKYPDRKCCEVIPTVDFVYTVYVCMCVCLYVKVIL